jgi:hypothetical protein
MSFIRQTLAIGALSALAAAQTTAPKLDATCADVVIFMARGNDAPYNDGRLLRARPATTLRFSTMSLSEPTTALRSLRVLATVSLRSLRSTRSAHAPTS